MKISFSILAAFSSWLLKLECSFNKNKREQTEETEN